MLVFAIFILLEIMPKHQNLCLTSIMVITSQLRAKFLLIIDSGTSTCHACVLRNAINKDGVDRDDISMCKIGYL